jgi:hypothetical protein
MAVITCRELNSVGRESHVDEVHILVESNDNEISLRDGAASKVYLFVMVPISVF